MRSGGSRLHAGSKANKESERRTVEMTPREMESGTKKLAPDIASKLRHLTHDLSNSLETINQACYLLGRTRLDANGKKWQSMIDTAAGDAARINRNIREILRSETEKPAKRRAS